MPPLSGFTNNPFRTRADVFRAAFALLRPLEPYKSPAQARIRLPTTTGAGFDDVAARLEGFARPLWAVAPMLEVDGPDSVLGLDLSSWPKGIAAGVDPLHPEYWGDISDFDQRMVEMESIAISLLAAPSKFLSELSDADVGNMKAWLTQINDHEMPRNNWLWFRIFVNLALIRALGVPASQLQHQIDADFATLDSFELADGWSSDGIWGDDRKQADYYSGSFAIQFAQLLYVRFAAPGDARAERYRLRAVEFAASYWRYFDVNGAAIPFGRSLTYRFAMAAFWAAIVVAEIRLPPPLDHSGTVKGLLLRHLRWWAAHPAMFNLDGTLSIGFCYPNMYMCEDYNSPQSVYWCLKSLIILFVPDNHAFWTCEEQPHPLAGALARELSPVEAIEPPGHIACSTAEHHFILSGGQMTSKYFKAREAKYGKFAYSSAFAFSVPAGLALHQIAPDSTLSASLDGGETWKVRWKPVDVRIEPTEIFHGSASPQSVPSLISTWRPWGYLDIMVETRLIPLVHQFPGWHVRLHRVRCSGLKTTVPWMEKLTFVDGGFAIVSEAATGLFIPEVNPHAVTQEGWSETENAALIRSLAGASGIRDLTPLLQSKSQVKTNAVPSILRADPNTNLIAQRTFIPASKHEVVINTGHTETNSEFWLASAVFGVSENPSMTPQHIWELWTDYPQLSWTPESGKVTIKSCLHYDKLA